VNLGGLSQLSEDLQKMGARNCGCDSIDREEWRRVLEEAKVQHGKQRFVFKPLPIINAPV
jgi:hypothetical protein